MIKSAVKEYIFEQDSVTGACHASTILPLPDGSCLAAWFGGKREKADDVEIYVSRRNADAGWSCPVSVSENDDIAHWNPVLYEDADGRIVLFYKHGREIDEWVTKTVTLSPEGEKLSVPAELVPGDTSGGRGPVKNKCLRLKDGTLLAPASTEQGDWKCFIDRSTDAGKTWKRCNFIDAPRYKGLKTGLIQPSLWQDEKGVHCFMRSDKGAIYRSDSSDGILWSKATRTRLPNNNSGLDLATDSHGRIFLVCNPVGVNWGVRHPLTLSVSEDGGKHFTDILSLEPGKGEFSYPAIVCKNDVLYITYTHKRKQIVFWKIELE